MAMIDLDFGEENIMKFPEANFKQVRIHFFMGLEEMATISTKNGSILCIYIRDALQKSKNDSNRVGSR